MNQQKSASVKVNPNQYRKWLDAMPAGIQKSQTVHLEFRAAMHHEEWMAMTIEARRIGVTIEQLCGAIVARSGESLAHGDEFRADIMIYVR